MSERYPGGIISKTAPTVTTSSAPGIWTLEQQAAYQKAGTWPFGGPFNYIEDVFSTWLYSGNSSTQTITNNIDLSSKGGMVWAKMRNVAGANHVVSDTARGTNKQVYPSSTLAQDTVANGLTAFNSNGFTLGNNPVWNDGSSSQTYASWTFRKQAKFFDVVTYTGTGAAQQIAHSLGSTPGCIIVKRTDAATDWFVYHQNLTAGYGLRLNTTAAEALVSGGNGISYGVTSTYFTVQGGSLVGASGGTYVAYVFAHNAGGFGLTGTDNVISCGSYTGNGSISGPSITLGYEPQWVLIKNASSAVSWVVFDNMRGMSYSNALGLVPNTTAADSTFSPASPIPTATGFNIATTTATLNQSGSTFIYIAIRRGPMKTPTSASTVFSASTRTGNGVSYTVTTSSFAPDVYLAGDLQATTNGGLGQTTTQRLIGTTTYLLTNSSAAAGTNSFWTTIDWGIRSITSQAGLSTSGYPYVDYLFGRAPGFFDVVCYTGDGVVGRSVAHNLGVTPELVIIKQRTGVMNWIAGQGASFGASQLYLDAAVSRSSTALDMSLQTSTNIVLGASGLVVGVNTSGQTYVAYLFASCPGVSKVGTYSGTGATQTISCGFAARFVMIKRTDGSPPGSTNGNWWVWDTARGMVAGNDTRFALNSTADYLNANWVYTNASGFQIVTTDATVNASGGTYIYLAIA